MRRGFDDLRGRDRKILAQHGQLDGRAGRFEIGRAALEERLVGEHRDGRRAASIDRRAAMRAGSKSAARTPLLGEAFLTSAMIAGAFTRKAARKSRRPASCVSAADAHAESEASARDTSSRFVATIRARMSGTVSIKGVLSS